MTAIDGDIPKVLAAVIVHGGTIAKAVASSGRYAKVKASTRALDVLDGLTRAEFRKKFHCNCNEYNAVATEFGTAV
jgi:endoribonuclease Dicer